MSRFIPEDIKNRIRDSVDIVELVSRYLSLKKTGSSYKALCPFHKEKTPSFSVSPSRQSFHCFGCGKGGDVFHFIMAMDRLSFPEAVRSLAKQTGIEVPDTRRFQTDAGRDERTGLYEANRRAADFFARMLAAPAGKKVREYIERRGISQEMIEKCCLGYSPDSWDGLIRAAGAADVSPALLCKAGLAIRREDGSGCYDRFRNRLMFPIFDTQDRVVGFGARAMGEDEVKYLNSPETPVFSKGRNLYGLNWARKSIVDNKRVAVVEGYTDVIMAHQHGCEAVVATLGTALTREHIRLLRRFAERVDVVFDSDTAGQQAAERSMEVFLTEGAGELVAAGFEVRVATIEGEKDPCELIAEQGAEAFQKTVDAAVDVFTKKIQIAARRHDPSTIEGKTKAIDEVLALVALVPNAVGRELRIDAAVKMLSDRFGVSNEALRAQFARIERRKRRITRPTEEPPGRAVRYDPAERGVLDVLLTVPDLVDQIFDRLRTDDFENENLRQLYQMMKELHETDGTVNASRLLGNLEDPELASLVSGIVNHPPRRGVEGAGLDCVRALLRRRGQREIRRLMTQLERANASGDEKLADELNMQRLRVQREVLAI